MKVVILAGGLPSTLTAEEERVPKPMAEIGGRPILWHIMKSYSYYGYKDFVICTGYKGDLIKDYFRNFYIYQSDITVDLSTNEIKIHRKKTEDWKVSVIDTGLTSTVTERVLMVQEYLAGEPFIVTYGDCVSNINIAEMAELHKKNKKAATFAVARPTGRNEIFPIDEYGNVDFNNGRKRASNSWVNACTMIFEPHIVSYLNRDDALLETEMLKKLALENQVETYRHDGFWIPIETIRDKTLLERMWNKKEAPWKVWEE